MTDPRRTLPSVGSLLESAGVRTLLERAPRDLVVSAVRSAIDLARLDPASAPSSAPDWEEAVRSRLEELEAATLRPVFNATGVVLHTNLGRAPLANAALDAIQRISSGYSNLEYDLEEGTRGSRHVHCASLIAELTGAEDGMVVNNCAAALVLALSVFSRGREAVVSRGELIEIGGSFRVPEIMSASGAVLREVGTTNRTHLGDYRAAIGPNTGAIVKVHRSNFRMSGFVADVPASDLAAVAAEAQIPLLHDFGSGLLVSLERFGLTGEPPAREVVRGGATLVLMSGDKLLGGPQAGVIAGTRSAVEALRKHPLARALRVDKLTLAALEATLRLYRDEETALREIPVLAMLGASKDAVMRRAESLALALREHGIAAVARPSEATVGGGAFPSALIPSYAAAIAAGAEEAERRLRTAATPVVGRIAGGELLLDLRSIPERDDAALRQAAIQALA